MDIPGESRLGLLRDALGVSHDVQLAAITALTDARLVSVVTLGFGWKNFIHSDQEVHQRDAGCNDNKCFRQYFVHLGHFKPGGRRQR